MRYVGQEHAVTVDLPLSVFAEAGSQGDQAAFRRRCTCMRYGTSAPAERAEIVSLRTHRHRPDAQAAAGEDPRGTAAPPRRRSPASGRCISSGQASSRRRPIARAELLAGNRISGPALIEEHASTTVLMPGDRLTVDDYGNLVIAVAGAR